MMVCTIRCWDVEADLVRLRLANRHGQLSGDTRPIGLWNWESGLLIGISDPTDVAAKIKDILVYFMELTHTASL